MAIDSFKVVACFFGTLQCAVIGLAIAIEIYAWQAHNQSSIDLSSLEQITENWEKQPFTSVVVQTTPCSDKQEPMYTYQWAGTESGCYLRNAAYYDDEVRFYNKVPIYRYAHLPGNATCSFNEMIAPMAPRYGSLIAGVNVCGIRGGDPWKDVVRPNLETGKCPEKTEPCTNVTNKENTVCYPKAQHKAKCPLTDMQFVTDADESWINDSYDVIDPGIGKYLVTSKKTNAAPLTDSTFEFKPCMKPGFQSIDPSRGLWYPLEFDQGNICPEDTKTTGFVFDGRYKETGLVDSLWNVQAGNGVLEALQMLPGYFQVVNES